jgi:superfamily II DNA or RNA helicase
VAAPDEKALWARIQKLTAPEKFFLQVKSLLFPPVNNKQFERLRDRMGMVQPQGSHWVRLMADSVQQLTRAGLLVEDGGVDPRLRHAIAAEATATPAGTALAAAIDRFLLPGLQSTSAAQGVANMERRLTVTIYGNNAVGFDAMISYFRNPLDDPERPHILDRLFGNTIVTQAWLASRAPQIGYSILDLKLHLALFRNQRLPDFVELTTYARALPESEDTAGFRTAMLEFDILSGDIASAAAGLAGDTDMTIWNRLSLQGQIDLLADRPDEAVKNFRTALKELRKAMRRRKVFLGGQSGLFFLLALLRTGDPAVFAEMQTLLEGESEVARAPQQRALDALQAWLWVLQGMQDKADSAFGKIKPVAFGDPLAEAIIVLARHAFDQAETKVAEPGLTGRFAALRNGAKLLAHMHAAVLADVAADAKPYIDFMAQADPLIRLPFARITRPSLPWQRALESIASLIAPKDAPAAIAVAGRDKRLVWFVDPDRMTAEPLEQSPRGRDGWTDGRPVALKRFREHDARLTYLTEHDRRVVALIRKVDYWGRADYELDGERALPALIGHPLVFDSRRRTQQIELVSYPVELVVSEQADGWRVALSHSAEGSKVVVEAETPSRYRVIAINDDAKALGKLLGKKGLSVPAAGRDQLTHLLKREAPKLPIRADWADSQPAVAGAPAPVVQLVPEGEGLRANLVVRPFGAEGPAYVAGIGGRSVLASLGRAAPQRALRDLDQEIAEREALIAACPTLRDRRAADAHEVAVDDLEGALELLGELAAVADGVAVEWPQGQRLSVRPALQSQAKVKISQTRDWFGVDGTVTLDDGEVLEMRVLLDRLSEARGRFIRLDDGRFLALTRQLQAQLQRLAAISEPDKRGRRLHRLAAPALEEVLSGAAVDADPGWRRQIERVRAAERFTPAVPSTLQCALRDYQAEGFFWMSRLARWGAGACLADDMGLGKTVQAIAVLLDHADSGASLVVAPTSVCGNWAIELQRFAPSLAVYRMSRTWNEESLAALGARDVLLCSYTMLQQHAERLGAVAWRVAILDEAQAIKNAETKRAQASLGLQADFRLALSGTPIENYLDELWSLFQFLNPGLLGSREAFQKKFAGPIERDRDPAARQGLRTLIRPFLLRRTKADVLSELPPRIEQTVVVEMEAEERAFYEALRQRALERLAALDVKAGARRVYMLAEITRLRRACCNPALIEPEAGLPSAKLAALLELVDELLRNGHKALVFSQFVGHLHLVRAALEARGIKLQYLDGSTPAAERDRCVAAFQSGEGALFLISLKAGGSGLNLTAADYVIHLDPWWNPAVEDQASDRAHRIGQDRPVTIYRLIVQDSIEERILALHRDKRDLASALLEGSEISARLDEDELFALIRGERVDQGVQIPAQLETAT